MKYDLKNNKYFRWGVTAFLTIAASICFYYLLFHGSSIKTGFHTIIGILMPVVFGLVTAYLLTPVLNFIETKLLFPLCRKMKVKESRKRNSIVRGIGILITAFLFVTLIYSLVAMMLSQIVPSIVNIASNFDTYISNFTKWISKLMDDNPELGSQITFLIDKYSVELENWLNNTVLTKTSQVIMTVSLSVINILKSLWDFIIGFVISIYVLASKEKFAGQAKKMAYAFFEQKTANDPRIEIVALAKKYPQGGEKQLVDAVINRQVPAPPAMPVLYRNHVIADTVCGTGQRDCGCDQYYSLLWSLSGSYSQCHPDPCGGSDAPFKLCLFRPVHSGVTAV